MAKSKTYRDSRIASMAEHDRLVNKAQNNGIFHIRRPIQEYDRSYMGCIAASLQEVPMLDEGLSSYKAKSMGVTVVGNSIMPKKLLRSKSIKTAEVIDEIPNLDRVLRVHLGELALFGSKYIPNRKLGIHVISPHVHDEHSDIVEAYADRGFDLKPNPHDEGGAYIPHISIGILSRRATTYLSDPQNLEMLNSRAEFIGEDVDLAPYTIPKTVLEWHRRDQ